MANNEDYVVDLRFDSPLRAGDTLIHEIGHFKGSNEAVIVYASRHNEVVTRPVDDRGERAMVDLKSIFPAYTHLFEQLSAEYDRTREWQFFKQARLLRRMSKVNRDYTYWFMRAVQPLIDEVKAEDKAKAEAKSE